MTVISALVLFAMIWFVALLVALPIGLTTQGEAGEVVPGTPVLGAGRRDDPPEDDLGDRRHAARSGCRSAP